MFSTSKLVTRFIDGFTSKRNSQSITYSLNGSEHIYWILNFENEVHSIWVKWTSGLQECKGNFIFPKLSGAYNSFRSGSKNFKFFFVGATRRSQIATPSPYPSPPESSWWEGGV